MKKMGLGRGLDALLPEGDLDGEAVRQIPLSEIDRNPSQPRAAFDEAGLNSLSESIRSSGVLMPLLVSEQPGGRYQIIAGERRFRAARIAGLKEVPCLVRSLTEEQKMEAALIENLQREDLNPVEMAEGIRALMEKCGYTQENVSDRLGLSRPTITNTLRLLFLDDDILTALRQGRLTSGHGRVLAGIQDDELRRVLFQKTLRENLSVRQLEMLVTDVPVQKPAPKPHVEKELSAELKDMQERLRSAVGIRNVSLRGTEKKGKVTLSYDNAEELELIYAALETLEGR